MGDVVEMKRTVKAQVQRFGHYFRVEYRAGVSPEQSDPQAALYLNNVFFAWLGVSLPTGEWKDVFLDLDDDYTLVEPQMVGMCPSTENVADHKFLIETEEYILALLADELGGQLDASAEPKKDDTPAPDPRNLHPRERGHRVVEVWHNHGAEPAQLPDLLAIEVYDALEGMGMALADAVDEHIADGGERRENGNLIRALVEDTLQRWHGGGA